LKGQDGNICLLVGTRKGAFIYTSDGSRKRWKLSGPHLKGNEVYHMAYDRRNGIVFASVSSGHWGPTLATSNDLGGGWKVSKTPPKFPKGSGLSVARVWHIRPGADDEPGVVYAGVEPACLFKSEDGGKSWSVNRALLKHPTRKKWQAGGGGLCLHTIVPDSRSPKRMHIAISSVGTMYTDDGGESWEFRNKNVLADFQPNKYPVYGQCVHKLAVNEAAPDVIFQQNHCGVYRSDDGGRNWIDIRGNLPSRFGFPVAVDANQPRRVYVAPLEGDFSRIPPDGHFAVWASDKGGGEWAKLDAGLPDVSFFTVLRDGMVADKEDPCGLYFGTTTGQLFASRDQGNSWERITDGLPPILSVSVSSV
jgi:photosystem II stability/assembly factor-like uncharacterized protein